jgi:general secretion pathway protein C
MRPRIVLFLLALAAPPTLADISPPAPALVAAARSGCGFDRPDEARAIHCAGDRCVVRRWLVDRVLDRASELATCARIVPALVDGRPSGFKLYAIRPGSLIARMLLRNGDTIQRINGYELSSPDTALEVYTRLRTSSEYVVDLERRGQPMRLFYRIR